jgi:hypothetical protein
MGCHLGCVATFISSSLVHYVFNGFSTTTVILAYTRSLCIHFFCDVIISSNPMCDIFQTFSLRSVAV